MATMKEIDPKDGDVIRGAEGNRVVCVVGGELFWNGQFISAYGGSNFTLISRGEVAETKAVLSQRSEDRRLAKSSSELDRKYS